MQTPMIAPGRARAVLVAAAALLAAGCQDYNFNPVGHCLIAPARERIPLSNISTADVLFVVDDSGSMKGEQEALAQGFSAFIANLDQTNRDRVTLGQAPIDFHIAVTTTSVFYNAEIPSKTVVCRGDCPGASGNVCCEMTSSQAGLTPTRPYGTTPVACQNVGASCGAMDTKFRFDGSCAAGNATNGTPYPQGAFVGKAGAPRVLHFDKELYLADGETRSASLPACSDGGQECNRQGFTSTQLTSWFASQQGGVWSGNVIAGTCGSGEEQGLMAAQLALEKALAGSQTDTYDARGVAAPPAALVKAEWPHKDSKLVLVFLGDEDDCSSGFDSKFGADPSRGVIMTAAGRPGADACTDDAGKPPSEQRRKQLADFVSYYTGLGRPVAAAFIVSTQQSACVDDACTPGICCPVDGSGNFTCKDLVSGAPVCSNNTCGGQAGGIRLLDTGTLLTQKQVLPRPDVVKGSICDNDFDAILNRVAEIVKPPTGLTLPTTPAAAEVTVLRIARPDGTTRKTCSGPAPATLSAADAAKDYDWWFTATEKQGTPAEQQPVAVSQNVFINHGTPPGTGNCEANPGETYSADYVGQLPEGGCQTREDCRQAMSGFPRSWTCYAGGSQEAGWTQPTPQVPGTCVCGDLSPEYAGTPQDSW